MTTLVHGEVARGLKVVLRQKRLGDAVNDYRWRTAADLSRYDAARPLTTTYQEFLAFYREDLLFPSAYRRSLAIEDLGGRHIGNVMYYNIDSLRREAELGITIGEREYWGAGYGADAVRLLVERLLHEQGYRRLHLKTLTWNDRARRCFEKVGFIECGRADRGGNDFVLMELLNEREAPGDDAQVRPFPAIP